MTDEELELRHPLTPAAKRLLRIAATNAYAVLIEPDNPYSFDDETRRPEYEKAKLAQRKAMKPFWALFFRGWVTDAKGKAQVTPRGYQHAFQVTSDGLVAFRDLVA